MFCCGLGDIRRTCADSPSPSPCAVCCFEGKSFPLLMLLLGETTTTTKAKYLAVEMNFPLLMLLLGETTTTTKAKYLAVEMTSASITNTRSRLNEHWHWSNSRTNNIARQILAFLLCISNSFPPSILQQWDFANNYQTEFGYKIEKVSSAKSFVCHHQ